MRERLRYNVSWSASWALTFMGTPSRLNLNHRNQRAVRLGSIHPGCSSDNLEPMKVYCETSSLFTNARREPNEMHALADLLAEHRTGNITMFLSRVALREVVKTLDAIIREQLIADYEALVSTPLDEKVLGSYTVTDQYGGSISNPLVADVQDDSIVQKLIQRGFKPRKPQEKVCDAEHIAQAVSNKCGGRRSLDGG